MSDYDKRLELERIKRAQNILGRNRDKTFVRRIMNPENFPVINNEDGSASTHRMASGEADGKYYVYPTIIYDNGELTQNKFRNGAFKKAFDAGQYIEFDNEKDASWFAENYKAGTTLE